MASALGSSLNVQLQFYLRPVSAPAFPLWNQCSASSRHNESLFRQDANKEPDSCTSCWCDGYAEALQCFPVNSLCHSVDTFMENSSGSFYSTAKGRSRVDCLPVDSLPCL